MIRKINVNIWNKNIGHVGLIGKVPYFQYNSDFENHFQLSPIKMPFSKNKKHLFYDLIYENSPFYGLPGFIADSLPDKFGGELIKEWLKLQGKTENDITILERLAYVGTRGIGAIEFEPILTQDFSYENNIEIPEIFEIVEKILVKKESLNEKMEKENSISKENIKQIISIGTSAGGARAKAIISIKKTENETIIKAGGLSLDGFEDYLIKFDSALNSDKENQDGAGHTNIEYAYYLMAKDCGINMSDCFLLEQKTENGSFFHFLTKRFDRYLDEYNKVNKLHMISLAGLLHNDFNKSRTLDYLDVFNLIDKLIPNEEERQNNKIEFFKRMVFNVFARNQDDHSKNISFLMDKKGNWKISPFYDVTFAYNPNGLWTSKHQMTILSYSKNEEINNDVLLEVGRKANINETICKEIIENTLNILSNFKFYMEKAKVKKERIELIEPFLRIKTPILNKTQNKKEIKKHKL